MAEFNDLTKVFAQNVRAYRDFEGLTQTELARRMKMRGFPFHQQTIQRIEDHLRPVKLDEAYALAEVFGVTIDRLSWTNESLRRREIGDFMFGAAEITTAVIVGYGEWRSASSQMVSHLQFLLDSDPENPRIQVGAALLLKMRETEKEMYSTMERLLGVPFLSRIFSDADDQGGEAPDPTDLDADLRSKISQILDEVNIGSKFAKMAPEDLADIYISAGQPPGGGERIHAVSRLAGADDTSASRDDYTLAADEDGSIQDEQEDYNEP